MGMLRCAAAALVATVVASSLAGAQFTYNSPTGRVLPSSVSPVGGIVVDLIGLNGARVVAQRAATGLFIGDAPALPLFSIGTQAGFSDALLSQLGGGLAKAAFRVSLYDGDTRAGDFDDGDNFLQINRIRIGNFSDVSTIETDGVGGVSGTGDIANGFGNNILNTGFFYTANPTTLSAIFASLLARHEIDYGYEDIDFPGEQYLDFTQGIDADIVDIGQPPVVVDPGGPTVTPEPTTVALILAGFAGLAGIARRRRVAS